MSHRSLVEFNHDLGPRPLWSVRQLADWAARFSRFLNSGSAQDLPEGAMLVATRHHSDPAFTGWTPPAEHVRPDGFECLGWMNGRWCLVRWDGQRDHRRPRPFWFDVAHRPEHSRANPPAAFLPLPPPPETTP